MKIDYSLNDLIECWKVLKIKKGDTIYITGNLFFLGLYNHQKDILSDFFETLSDKIGPSGTIAFPTHSWSLVNSKKVFSIKKTPSETGVLTEYLRKKKRSF